MRRIETFTIRVNKEELREIAELALWTRRTKADALRLLIHAYFQILVKEGKPMQNGESDNNPQ